jgi:hypothetical protein
VISFDSEFFTTCGAAALFVLIALRTHSHAGGGPAGEGKKMASVKRFWMP